MTRYDVVERFLPYLSVGKKVADDYFLTDGVIFYGKYGYIISRNGIGRILVDDRILPVTPIMWNFPEEDITEASEKSIAEIRKTTFLRQKSPIIFLRKKDLVTLVKDLTPKRESKSKVVLDIGDHIVGMTLRKNEILAEKKINLRKSSEFTGKIEFNLFDFKKVVLEIFSDYDIIGIQLSKNPVMFGRRADKTKPVIDFVFKEVCCHD